MKSDEVIFAFFSDRRLNTHIMFIISLIVFNLLHVAKSDAVNGELGKNGTTGGGSFRIQHFHMNKPARNRNNSWEIPQRVFIHQHHTAVCLFQSGKGKHFFGASRA